MIFIKNTAKSKGIVLLSEENGSALLFVIFILTVISMLAAAIFAVHLIQRNFIVSDMHSVQAKYLAEAGIYLAFNRLHDEPEWRPVDELLVVDGADSVRVTVEPWGGFYRLTSEASIREQSRKISVLAADRKIEELGYAIVIGDVSTRINIAGNTHITGDLLVGQYGVREASFRGLPFRGRFDGEITSVPDHLMPFYDDFLFRETIEVYQLDNNTAEGSINNIERTRYYSESVIFTDRENDLFSDSMIIYVEGDLTLAGTLSLPPETVFSVTGSIHIEDHVKGEQLLLLAGESIYLSGEVLLSGQIMAKENIIVSENAQMLYPSTAYLSGILDENLRKGSIQLLDNARIDGTVIYPPSDRPDAIERGKVIIEKGASIRGVLYNSGRLTGTGRVSGTVITFQYFFYEAPTEYINWLRDIRVNNTARPENYLSPFGFRDRVEPQVLLYKAR